MAFAFGFVLIFLLLSVGFFSLRPRRSDAAVPMEAFDIFSLAARYRPMMRLLDGSDFELVNNAGDPGLLRKVKRQRRAIFRGYLRSLRRDHARLCAHMRAMVLSSTIDCSHLLVELYRAEMQFRLTTVNVNFMLALHAIGIPNVAVWGLMDRFEKLRQRAELLAPTEEAQLRSVA